MELYENKKLFIELIEEISKNTKINETIIEKDYFVIFFLYHLKKKIPGLLFKGGTSCSHAYHAIDRFSEDIDLSLISEHLGRGEKIKANKAILELCDELHFTILNRDVVIKHSHGNFNVYYIEYPMVFDSGITKPYIQVEMFFHIKSYPYENKTINSILGEWIYKNNKLLAADYGLLPFEISTVTLERTFVDKVFAICDYFEFNEPQRNSRHIYDIYKIGNLINLSSPTLIELIKMVRLDRQKNSKCVSAKSDYNINEALSMIIKSNFYKKDYNNVTKLLLVKQISYETSIEMIKTIIRLKIFDN